MSSKPRPRTTRPTAEVQLPPWRTDVLRCLACGAPLVELQHDGLSCATNCGACYPVVQGVPILLNDAHSIFSTADVIASMSAATQRSRVKATLQRVFPDIGNNVHADANFRRFRELLLGRAARPRVLIVGGRIPGAGIQALTTHPSIDILCTDVAPGPETMLICDAHELPFADGSFDGVVAQAVLEHVADPVRCVGEIHRVLKPNGVVYAEIPFMQQVHAGRYDFTRFTHMGLLRLFRHFDEISSGPTCGPGMALAWSYEFFLASLLGRRGRPVARALSRLTAFWLKHVDRLIIDGRASFDGASAYFILASRSDNPRSERTILQQYRGLG